MNALLELARWCRQRRCSADGVPACPTTPEPLSPPAPETPDGGAAASGARLTFRFARPGAAPFYTQAVADVGGAAEIKIEVEEASLPDSSLLVKANFEGRTATRKFMLRKVE